jgi:hypothetical protein
VNASANTRAENLTPGETHCGIFYELGGCALLLSLPEAEVERAIILWPNNKPAK